MKKEYCPVCQKEVFYKIEKRIIHSDESEVPFDYEESVAICNECGEELYVDEIETNNQESFKKAYREKNEIITNDEIREILDKYNVGKRVLPIILEIGELTISRYLDGYIPTRKISNLLKSILNSPELYKEYLEKNKYLISKNAYAKSSNKVNNLLGIQYFDEKLERYADYIIINNEETTNLVLNKLLYFCDVVNRAITGKKLFNSHCSAWEYGPVYGQIYYENKCFGNNPIVKDEDLEISIENKELVDEIIECFGIYSGGVLSSFTHNDGPWKETFDPSNNKKFITDEKMFEYAKRLKEEYHVNSIKDISKYSNKLFEKYKENKFKLTLSKTDL